MPGRSRAEVEAVKGDHERCVGLGSCEQEPPGVGAEVCVKDVVPPGLHRDGRDGFERVDRQGVLEVRGLLEQSRAHDLLVHWFAGAGSHARVHSHFMAPPQQAEHFRGDERLGHCRKAPTRNATLSDSGLSAASRAIGPASRMNARTNRSRVWVERAHARPSRPRRTRALWSSSSHPTASENASRPSSPRPVPSPDVRAEAGCHALGILAADDRCRCVQRLEEADGECLVNGRVDDHPRGLEESRLLWAVDMRQGAEIRQADGQAARRQALRSATVRASGTPRRGSGEPARRRPTGA